jgi:hypothetical protein
MSVFTGIAALGLQKRIRSPASVYRWPCPTKSPIDHGMSDMRDFSAPRRLADQGDVIIGSALCFSAYSRFHKSIVFMTN